MVDSDDRSSGGDGEFCSWMDMKRRESDKKRRFSEDQIKSLESMFESQTKLEPKQKSQLATELGLQPRQVAIWFQNKRARWKSKQLEREYNSLRTDYDALLSSFESLKNEKQLLVKQLKSLSELLEKPLERSDREGKEEEKPSLSMKQDSDLKTAVLSDDQDHKKLNYLSEEEEEAELFRPMSSSLSSSVEQHFCFQSTTWPLDHSATNSQWWEFYGL